MIRASVIAATLSALGVTMSPLASQSVPFVPGMVITHSVQLRAGRYVLPAGDSVGLVIRGDNVTVNCAGVELIGHDDARHPDEFSGTAVRIDGGRNIELHGLSAHGFRVGVIARHATRLTLIDNDLSYNWKPRLFSGITKESLIDWLDFHQNDKDEWLRYGAGIYLADVTIGELRGNRVTHGMDGIMLVRSTGIRVWNNTLSYNSGVGLGLYRSSRNVVMHNRIDYDVRGYSDGFFNRGQDSAGLLMYEQSSNNIVAYNSVTHGGDGLFLWAGQSTMDSGLGGCNDNLFYGNDFSYAPANGIEATFSRNAFVNNRIAGNWHGIWGGYSYSSTIMGNRFFDNVEGIAIEHGQDNRIVGNQFGGDSTGIHLWWSAIEPSDWGYPRHRDTRSRDYTILANTFSDERVGIRVAGTQQLRADDNAFHAVDTIARATGDTAGWSFRSTNRNATLTEIPGRYKVSRLPGGIDPMMPKTALKGRHTIIVDEWGPYDWKSPKLWPAGSDNATPLKLRVLGPAGHWRVVARDGVASLSADSGHVGDALTVTPLAGREADFDVELEYRGTSVVTSFGETIDAGKPVRFGWMRSEPATRWHLSFFAWDSTRTPLADASAVSAALRAAPVATLDTNRLDLTWYAPPRTGIPQSNVLTRAESEVTLAQGKYLLRSIADDAVRVFVDGKLVLDDWNPGESHRKEATIGGGGTHRFVVEHLQLTGWYELRLDIERVKGQGP